MIYLFTFVGYIEWQPLQKFISRVGIRNQLAIVSQKGDQYFVHITDLSAYVNLSSILWRRLRLSRRNFLPWSDSRRRWHRSCSWRSMWTPSPSSRLPCRCQVSVPSRRSTTRPSVSELRTRSPAESRSHQRWAPRSACTWRRNRFLEELKSNNHTKKVTQEFISLGGMKKSKAMARYALRSWHDTELPSTHYTRKHIFRGTAYKPWKFY